MIDWLYCDDLLVFFLQVFFNHASTDTDIQSSLFNLAVNTMVLECGGGGD